MTKTKPEEQSAPQAPRRRRKPRGDDGPQTLIVNDPKKDLGNPPPGYNDQPKRPRRGKAS
jgi:hypothetical protein